MDRICKEKSSIKAPLICDENTASDIAIESKARRLKGLGCAFLFLGTANWQWLFSLGGLFHPRLLLPEK